MNAENKNAAPEDQDDTSMEDILHSIRDVIANPDKPKDANDSPEEKEMAEQDEDMETEEMEPQPQEDEEEVLELTDIVDEEEDAGEENADVLSNIDAALSEDESSSFEEETDDAPVPQERVSEPEKPVQKQQSAQDHLVSEKAAKASAEALQGLVKKVPKPYLASPALRSGCTVEDLVIEALKPMLSEWLDENLPKLVEHIVEKEIKRLVPKDE